MEKLINEECLLLNDMYSEDMISDIENARNSNLLTKKKYRLNRINKRKEVFRNKSICDEEFDLYGDKKLYLGNNCKEYPRRNYVTCIRQAKQKNTNDKLKKNFNVGNGSGFKKLTTFPSDIYFY